MARTPSLTASAQGTSPEGIAHAVERWFVAAARELPWREPSAQPGVRRDPYRALVAEAMLQQTQVSRVVDKFVAFVDRFPNVQSLAGASEDDVLAMWTGLGYYRRARNLHAAAKIIIERFAGRVPSNIDDLRTLPGVGRYTAGAISSIAFNRVEPIIDGNVARVLLRVHNRDAASDDKAIQPWLWDQAALLARAARSPGVLNEGLMELGATVCTPGPGEPACMLCPLRAHCAAHEAGTQTTIPRPKTRAARRDIFCASLLITGADGAVLMEQRPRGNTMWGGLWQAITIERDDRSPTKAELARAVRLPARSLAKADSFEFLATHRRLMFEVFVARAPGAWAPSRGAFIELDRAMSLGLSTPQRRVLGLASASRRRPARRASS